MTGILINPNISTYFKLQGTSIAQEPPPPPPFCKYMWYIPITAPTKLIYPALITDLLNKYKSKGELKAEIVGRGGAWLDTGSVENFYKTTSFVSAIQNQQGFKIACIEEIAYLNKWISKKNKQEIVSYVPVMTFMSTE